MVEHMVADEDTAGVDVEVVAIDDAGPTRARVDQAATVPVRRSRRPLPSTLFEALRGGRP